MAGAYMLALVCFLAIATGLTKLLGLDMRAFVPVLTFRNSGNLGLPICLFAFGEAGLSFGICTFVIASLGGPHAGARDLCRSGARARRCCANPLAYVILVSVLFMGPPVSSRRSGCRTRSRSSRGWRSR